MNAQRGGGICGRSRDAKQRADAPRKAAKPRSATRDEEHPKLVHYRTVRLPGETDRLAHRAASNVFCKRATMGTP